MLGSPRNFLISCALMLGSCTNSAVETSFHITAKRPDGSPIALASVKLDGDIVGETNAFGTLQISKSLPTSNDHTITISVDDPTYYYSPYSQKFRLDDRSSKTIEILAVMYLAPKPKMPSRIQTKELPNSNISTLARSTASATTDTTPYPPLVELGLHHLDGAYDSITTENRAAMNRVLFNVHVYSGHAPIANAEVTWSNNKMDIATCLTNDRGRCALWTDTKLLGNSSILVRKVGFESSLKEIHPEENQNIRFNLRPGQTVDLRIFTSHPKSDVPADGVNISLGRDLVTSSNKCGFATLPIKLQERPLILTATHQNQEFMVRISEKNALADVVNLRLPLDLDSLKPDYVAFNVHTPTAHEINIDETTLRSILDAIHTETSARRPKHLTVSAERLASGEIGILPILENTGRSIKLSITMLDAEAGTVISEQIDGVALSPNDINTAVRKILTRLDARRSYHGVVTGSDSDGLVIWMDSHRSRPGDTIVIKTRNETLQATVSKVRSNQITAKIQGRELASETWQILGAIAQTEPLEPAPIRQILEFLPSLRPRAPELISLDAATKHLTENNPQQALKVLESMTDHSPKTEILKLHFSAQAYLQLGDITRAVATLYSALPLAIQNNMEIPEQIIATNLNRLKTELIPQMREDMDLTNALNELEAENHELLKQLLHHSQDFGPDFDAIKVTLTYSNILINQKRAVASDDRVTLSKLPNTWRELETTLSGLKLRDDQLLGLKQSIAANRANTELGRSHSKVKL